jgi:F0F1-type ATP synthase membrane subunit b/b'
LAAAAKLIGEKLDATGHAALIDRSLGEITSNRLQ